MTFVGQLTPILAQEAPAWNAIEAIAMIGGGLLIFSWVGNSMAGKQDRSWLPAYVVWAFLVKIVGGLARFYMVTGLYGTGDSYAYHEQGSILAAVWRGFVVPQVVQDTPTGTEMTELITGFLFAPYTPTLLGGFLIFTVLSFTGQLLFYAAARHWLEGYQLKMYALAVFFVPSMVFWPSSIGKDALMVFFLGLAAFGASRLLRFYQFSSLLFVGPGLYLASLVRSHVAAVMGLAIVLAALFGKPPKEYKATPKRAIMIGVAVVGAAFSLITFSASFGVSVDGGERGTQAPEEFLADVSEQTATGGSEVEGGAVGSPAQLPGAVIKVLYRPLIYEAGSMQALASAMEGTALLVITIWKFPTMWRRKGQLREKPLLMMAFFYTGGFIVGFSAILNLGILARQRVQVLPLFLMVLVGLGWEKTAPRRKAPRGKRPEEADVEADTTDDESGVTEIAAPELTSTPAAAAGPAKRVPKQDEDG